MISCSNEVITPDVPHRSATGQSSRPDPCSGPTKRMPYDQSQLWDLFPLLAQFHKSCFSGIAIHQLGNPSKHPPILLADCSLHGPTTRIVVQSRASPITVVAHSNAVIVLLLSRGCCSRCRLGLGVLLSGLVIMLLLMMALLLM